ncbi:FliG C-terminal domain-containing protein [Shewanella fodinae]|uniref:FliG C-terminal domain-containing protein n=1 Tax=Shewanella fodinae TaxID=552357 RepID=UPI0019A5F436|nr:FliG C-terminal domain-containing protein [Shewanella fodinae]MCL2908029.1 flagellar motor switch protein FliG [Shewanella fodinae]GGZ12556.1 flagellar motor switch protein G [Shewanella fodinae]
MNPASPEFVSELSELDQAAILLLSMGEDNAANVIRRLGKGEVKALSERMAKIAHITQEDMSQTLQHFFDSYRNESGVSGASRRYLEKALDKAVGRKLARGMLDDIYGVTLIEELRCLEWVPSELIARFLEQEHAQMQALILAFLPPEQSSAVLALLPQERHEDLLFRIAGMREVSEHIIDDLRFALERCIEFVGQQTGARVDGVEKVAEIVNRYNGNKAEIIALLRQHDKQTAIAIEERMFDFDTIALQTEEVRAQLMNEISDELWIVALKGAKAEFIQSILQALPKRLAQVYQQQLDGLAPQPVRKVETARAEIMKIIRQMMSDGTIDYRLYQEDVLG